MPSFIEVVAFGSLRGEERFNSLNLHFQWHAILGLYHSSKRKLPEGKKD
jgi:hypothetical protein